MVAVKDKHFSPTGQLFVFTLVYLFKGASIVVNFSVDINVGLNYNFVVRNLYCILMISKIKLILIWRILVNSVPGQV